MKQHGRDARATLTPGKRTGLIVRRDFIKISGE